MSDQIQVSKTVNAAPEDLFAVLATPARHTEFDGASMLRGSEGSAAPVSGIGDQFIMNMNNANLGQYQMRNTVVSFEPNSKIGWAPELYPLDGYTDKVGDMQAKGHTYTWELQSAGEGRTTVTQTYDWSRVADPNFRGMFPMLTEDQLADSIDRAAAAAS